MSLKRKIRFTNYAQPGNDSTTELSATEDSLGSSNDPFAFPGMNSSAASIPTSDNAKPAKMPRLVLKLGGSSKKIAGEIESAEPPLPPIFPTITPNPTPDKKMKKKRGEKAERGKGKGRRKTATEKKQRKFKPKKDMVDINELMSQLDDSHQSRPDNPVPPAMLIPQPKLLQPIPGLLSIQPLAPVEPAPPSVPAPVVPVIREPFELLLDYYLRYLQRKDTGGYFGFPLTDSIAPNYSTIVKHPMDFSTMRKKLARGWYENLPQFRNDFELICSNAMTYNAPDTVYYRAAKKLARLGKKLMSKERISYVKRHVSGFDTISPELLGFDVPASALASRHLPQALLGSSNADGEPEIVAAAPLPEENMLVVERQIGSPAMSPSKFKTGSLCGPYETIPEENATEILEQLKAAAKDVSDRLATRNPRIIMPKRLSDGSITLNILNPDLKSTLTLGALAGPLKSGIDHLPTFDQRPKMDAVTVFEKYYKDYGSFSAHAPKFDSKGCIFTKEEVDLLKTIYGSERGAACAESLMRWGQQVRHPVVKRSIEKLINDATGGDHSDLVYLLNERIVARGELDKKFLMTQVAETSGDGLIPLEGSQEAAKEKLEQLKSLEKDGIDVGFLESLSEDFVKPPPPVASDLEAETLLSLNGEVLHQLCLEQTKRLATGSTAHLGNIPLPGENECALAELAIENLSKLLRMSSPKDVVSSVGIRKALNIT